MNRLNPFSANRLKEIAEGRRNRDGSLKVTAAELQARRGAFAAKVADAIAGGSKAPRRSRTARQKAKDAADKWFSEMRRI